MSQHARCGDKPSRKPRGRQPKLDVEWTLTPKEARFVVEYLKDLNATQAAIRSGYSEQSAGAIGYENLNKPHLKELIEAGKAKQLADAELSAARVLEEMRRLAFVDLAEFYDEATGDLLPIHQIRPEARAALAGVETLKRNVTAGDGVMDSVFKIRTYDKTKALESLAKHFGLLVDRVQVSGELSLVSERLKAARKRLAAREAA